MVWQIAVNSLYKSWWETVISFSVSYWAGCPDKYWPCCQQLREGELCVPGALSFFGVFCLVCCFEGFLSFFGLFVWWFGCFVLYYFHMTINGLCFYFTTLILLNYWEKKGSWLGDWVMTCDTLVLCWVLHRILPLWLWGLDLSSSFNAVLKHLIKFPCRIDGKSWICPRK